MPCMGVHISHRAATLLRVEVSMTNHLRDYVSNLEKYKGLEKPSHVGKIEIRRTAKIYVI